MKLNIGGGHVKIEGFTNIDRKVGIEAYPLKFPDSSIEEIRASHILEHFPGLDIPKVLAEWVRVLRPGAAIRLAVPDWDYIIEHRNDRKATAWLMGGQTDENDFHKSVFSEAALRNYMEDAGLVNIKPWVSENTDCASLPVSLNLEGNKPTAGSAVSESSETPNPTSGFLEAVPAETATIKISALASIPRLGFNDHWGCIVDSLRPFKIPIRRFSGAFWGQGMQRALETCVEDGLDWALCLDYDTLFSEKHLDVMLGVFGQNPHIDALAAMQVRRNSKYPLMTVKGSRGEEIDPYVPMKCNTAHFGLTLIRLDRLKDLPKPWFHATPGPDGTWTHDDHVDDDISFWKLWEREGRTLFVHPGVRVGHMELMVSELDAELKPRHVRVPDWYEQNKEQRSWNKKSDS